MAEVGGIELRVDDVGRLFNSLDPLPFRQRDLDPAVEEYVVGWARELPTAQAIRIVVHLPRPAAGTPAAGEVEAAIHSYFLYRADVLGLDLKELLRTGRLALLIGTGVLAACILAATLLGPSLPESPLRSFVEEGLIILGWVANWRPMEIFLYEWWPITRQRSLYRRLSSAKVELVSP